jgi:hypothetical protein
MNIFSITLVQRRATPLRKSFARKKIADSQGSPIEIACRSSLDRRKKHGRTRNQHQSINRQTEPICF